MAKLLTDRSVAQARAKDGKRTEFANSISPLRLVVQPSGAKSWATRFRLHGHPHKYTFGAYPAISLAAARTAAKNALESVSLGNDPMAAKRRGTPDDASVTAYVALYKELHVNGLRKGTRRYVERELDALADALGNRPIASITKSDLLGLQDRSARRGDGAKLTFTKVAKAFFRWATDDRDAITANPAASLKRPKMQKRKRYLNDEELRAAWHAADQAGGPHGALAKLLILTGCRRDEIASLQRRELNGDAIILPGERTKTGEPHEIYLTDAMRRVLNSLPKSGRFVLTGNDHSVNGGQRARNAIETPDLAHWTLHDLRRSFSTGCAKIGIEPYVIELMLNHQFEGEAGTYNKHKYAREMAVAWEKWSDHIAELVSEKLGT